MASNDISRVDARRFMSRPPRAYRQLSQNEKAMVAEWEPRQGAKALVHRRGFLLYYDFPLVYVALIFVERAHRSKGIATALLSKCSVPCMATVLDNRLWERLGWEIHEVAPDRVTVAVRGLTTPEHRDMFDMEVMRMALYSKLPMRVHDRMVSDHEFATTFQERLARSVRVMMDMRKSLVASGMPSQLALRTVLDSCLDEANQ